MKNSYVIAGAIILIAVLGFVLASKKTEAPTQENAPQESSTFMDGNYVLDTEASKIVWTGEFIGGLKETGTIMLSEGSAEVVGGIIQGGLFTIDMNTLSDSASKQRLTDHLKSEDFFSVATYPTATFVLKTFAPTSAEGAKIGRYVVGGNLTIKGIVQPISLMATVTQTGNIIEATGSFAINRADWSIKYNSPSFFQNLGDKAIRDAVEIKLNLKAVKSE